MVCVGWEDQPFFVKALENNEKSGRYRECHFPQSISVGFIGRTRSYCKGLVARARRAFWWDKSAEDSPWKSILVKFAHLLTVCLSMMSWTFWPKMLSVCSIMRDSKWFLEYSKIFGHHRWEFFYKVLLYSMLLYFILHYSMAESGSICGYSQNLGAFIRLKLSKVLSDRLDNSGSSPWLNTCYEIPIGTGDI